MTEPVKKPRKKPFAANAASIKYLRERNWIAGTVEQRIPKCFITRDLFNFIDIVAIDGLGVWKHVLAVQATTGDNAAARKQKIIANPTAKLWLIAGQRIVIHSWAKRGGAGKRKLWTCNIIEVTLADFA